MRYSKIKGISLPVSKLVLGCGSKKLWKGENCDELLDAALAFGITLFDTARGYGKSEEVLGDWMSRRGNRDRVIIQTKGALSGLFGLKSRVKEKCIREDLKRSLNALKTDRADVYILHRDDVREEVGWMVELLAELKEEDKIGVYGVSNWRYDRIIAANEYAYKHSLPQIAVSEPHFGLGDAGKWPWLGCISVTGKENAEEREWYKKTGMPLMAFSPLGGGFFSGRVSSQDRKSLKNISYAMRKGFGSDENFERLKRAEWLANEKGCTVAQIALAYSLNHEMNVFPITGSGSVNSLRASVAAVDIDMSEREERYLDLLD